MLELRFAAVASPRVRSALDRLLKHCRKVLAASHPPSHSFLLGGATQDQGIIKTNGPADWTDTGAGDEGDFFIVDPLNSSNVYLPLHPLSKSVWLGILGECRRSSPEFDVAGTKPRVLCGQRRERETAFVLCLNADVIRYGGGTNHALE